MTTRFKHAIAVIILIALSTVGLFFLFNALFSRPDEASVEAGIIEPVFTIHFWLMAFLFSMIMVIMLYSVFVFRRRAGDETDGPHVHGHTGLEIMWTLVPTLVVIGFGAYAYGVFIDLIEPNEGEKVFHVTGRQWSWSFAYPDANGRSDTELVLPVNQPVVLDLNSTDVLHSFWVPEFRVKQDLVPGFPQKLRLTPTVINTYKLRCAEICGFGHAIMLADVRVVSQADYDAYIAELLARKLPSEIADGAERAQEIWYTEYGCVTCHSLDGTEGAGPSWLGLYGSEEQLDDGTTIVVDEEYLRESILNPNAKIVAGFQSGVMSQTFAEQFSLREEEVLATESFEVDIVSDLIAFIRTLAE
jgi:cytochrome c oxidase subunit 2